VILESVVASALLIVSSWYFWYSYRTVTRRLDEYLRKDHVCPSLETNDPPVGITHTGCGWVSLTLKSVVDSWRGMSDRDTGWACPDTSCPDPFAPWIRSGWYEHRPVRLPNQKIHPTCHDVTAPTMPPQSEWICGLDCPSRERDDPTNHG